jgi:hypothetical protein
MAEILFIDAGAAAGRDHFGPTIVVGNVPAGDPPAAVGAPFAYFGDPGDGTGIQAAFAQAALSPEGGTVHIRRGDYAIGAQLTVAGFRVTGDGWSTRLFQSTTVRSVLLLTLDAGFLRLPEIEDFVIVGSQAAPGAIGTSIIDASTFGLAHIEKVDITQLVGSIENPNESLTSLILGTSSVRVRRCQLAGDSNVNAPVACIRFTDVLCETTDNRTGGCDIGIVVEDNARRAKITGNNGGNHTLVGIRIDEREAICIGNRVDNSLDGIVVASGSRSIVQGNSMVSNITTDEIRIEVAATNTIVIGNAIGGAVVNDLGVGTEAVHNI